MEELIGYILQFGGLNKQQIELISSKATKTQLCKDDYFAEAGTAFDQIVYVQEGIFRICYFNKNGDEITKYFIEENRLFSNPYKEDLMTEYIQALTDCKLIVFSRKDWNELSNTIIDWDTITHKIFQKGLVEKLDRRSALVNEDATTRYLTFLEKFPTLVNRVPLSYIASYLGITQQSLSRIRKNIS
ncbi:Crp/Fnr family transcriptional regulator [Galbibacter pacificus]|uniref:Crp/Fnr family transcriptional regulator n=1 Tax=Galbibacter pacificus TaxID=2996052 RepID=A0ABT6FUI7_9FLAO|nr:Crp/Fnr family transcriptional regulator [Galbibacter pacificus]MDG3583283.1 Crp/Fnr family transcriptional regulator [Galbibacter pacificus]MDG3586764.1 Crp/Fnr family transcriptional regulator [Galbibacter pacificus]